MRESITEANLCETFRTERLLFPSHMEAYNMLICIEFNSLPSNNTAILENSTLIFPETNHIAANFVLLPRSLGFATIHL